MGFLKFGKNLLNNLTQKAVTEEMISNAKAEMLLDKEYSKDKMISLLLQNDYPKLIFGSQYLPSEADTRKEFGIDTAEKILAFIRATDAGINIFASELIVITNKAIYTSTDSSNGRVPLNEVKNYIAVPVGKGDGWQNISKIFLIKSDMEITLMNKTITLGCSGIPEQSMVRLLFDIQRLPGTKTARDKLITWARQEAKANSNDSILPDTSRRVIEGLRLSKETDLGMDDMLISDAVFACDTGRMMRFIAMSSDEFSHYKDVIDEEISRLFMKMIDMNRDEKYLLSCIKSIEKKVDEEPLSVSQDDLLRFYDKKLGKITSVLKALTDMNLSMGTISSRADEYFDEKKTGHTKPNDVSYEIEKSGYAFETEKEIFLIKTIEAKNRRLLEFFLKLKNGEEIERKDYLAIDGCGLTPLHYAFLLGKKELAKKMAASISDYNQVFEDLPEEVSQVLNFTCWSLYFDCNDCTDEFLEKEAEIIVLRKTQSHLKRLLLACKGIVAVGNMTISSGKSAARTARENGDFDKYDSLSSRAEDLDGRLDNARDRIRQLQTEIDEIETEINEAKSRIRLRFREAVQDFSDKPSFAGFLYRFFKQSELYEKMLEGAFAHKQLFRYAGIYFFTEEDCSRWEANKKSDKKDRRQSENTYEEKWFSDAAYKDLNVLTSEYRKLMVQYHPDNNPDGLAAFLSIQKKREEILSSMK